MFYFNLAWFPLQGVGCDGVVGSSLKLDNCGQCGGKNEKCHIVSGIFMRQKLPSGYSKVTVIPAGACNINITELNLSPNYLGKSLSSHSFFIYLPIYLFIIYYCGAVVRTSDPHSRESRFETSCCRFEACAILFTPHCVRSISCINGYR